MNPFALANFIAGLEAWTEYIDREINKPDVTDRQADLLRIMGWLTIRSFVRGECNHTFKDSESCLLCGSVR